VVQTVAVLAIGLGGAVSVAQRVGTGELALGAVALALGAGCYGAALAFVDRHQGLGENFYFYATLALVLTLTGASVVLSPPALVVALSGLAVLAAVLANRFARVALVLHCAVYVTMAAGISGLFAAAFVAFTGTPVDGWPSLAPPAWIALVAAGTSLAVAAPARDALLTKVPRVVVALVVVSGCGAGPSHGPPVRWHAGRARLAGDAPRRRAGGRRGGARARHPPRTWRRSRAVLPGVVGGEARGRGRSPGRARSSCRWGCSASRWLQPRGSPVEREP
jgi:hypothetical protein